MSRTPFGPLRVLVADDSLVVRYATRALLLSHWPIDVVLAADGAEAARLATGSAFDLVLMDLQMPVMDGYAATRLIRQFESEHPLRRRTPVVAYTTSSGAAFEARLRESGIDASLPKPPEPQEMCAALRTWGAANAARVRCDVCRPCVRELDQAGSMGARGR
jgi:CheY-like chemotaxis protein